jgi:hypothetical protein
MDISATHNVTNLSPFDVGDEQGGESRTIPFQDEEDDASVETKQESFIRMIGGPITQARVK